MEHFISIIRHIRDTCLDICFPLRCMKCASKGTILCGSCAETIPESQTSLHNIYAGFIYRDPSLKKILKDLKYHNRYSIGQTLGQLLYDRMIEEISELRVFSLGAPIVVIPIPLSKSRHKSRGYNQSEKIAEGFISRNPRIFMLDTTSVKKHKETLPQAQIKEKEKRTTNISGCFSVLPEIDFNGRTVIVIDDIVTTGSTIQEMMHLLSEHGAKKVVSMTVAH